MHQPEEQSPQPKLQINTPCQMTINVLKGNRAIPVKEERAAIILLCISCITIYLISVCPIFVGEYFTHLDIRTQFIPYRSFYAAALSKGELGIWNPFLCRGYPNLAEGQTGVLHPVHILAYHFLPVTIAGTIELIGAVPFAFVGTFIFLRRSLQCSTFSSLTGSALFSFSTFFTVHFMHVNMLWTLAHLPWALYFSERLFHRTRSSHWHLLGLSLTILSTILLGHPQTVWFIGISILSLIIYISACTTPSRPVWQSLGLIVIANIAAFCIGTLQILPTYDYLNRSPRAIVTLTEYFNYSFPPFNLALNLAPYAVPPDSVGGPHVDIDTGRESYHIWHEYPNYFGVGLLLFLIVTALQNRSILKRMPKRLTLILLFLAILLLLSLGKYGGLVYILRFMPLVSKFRCPIRYLSLAYLLIAVVVAVFLSSNHLSTFKVPSRKVIIAIPFLLFGVSLWMHHSAGNLPIKHSSIWTVVYSPLICAGLLVTMALDKIPVIWRQLIVVLIILVDISVYNLPLLQSMRRFRLSQFETTKQEMLGANPNFRAHAGNNDPVLEGNMLTVGYLGIQPDMSMIEPSSNTSPEVMRRRILLASANRAYVTNNGQSYSIPFAGDIALPRARLVPNLKRTQDPIGEDLTCYDPRSTALTTTTHTLTSPPLADDEFAEIHHAGYAELLLKTQTRHPRLLVLSDRWWPHWRLTVNGRPQEIIPLYGHRLIGAEIPPGNNMIALHYRSSPFKSAIPFAVLGGLLILAVSMFLRTRCMAPDVR
jgi:hypothetical protein